MDNKYVYETFNNGFNLLVIPMKNTKLINIQLAINVGYDNETLEDNTLEVSHFLEHLFSCYTSNKYPSYKETSKIFSDLGVSENASVTYNLTKYDLSFEKKHFNIMFDLIKHTYTNFKIDNSILKQERTSVKEELNNILDDQYLDLNDKIIKTLYPNHIRGVSQKKNLKNVDKITNKQIYDFYKKYYIPMLSTLIIAGDVNLGIIQKIKKTFEKLKNNNNYCVKNLNIIPKLDKNIIFSKSKNNDLCNLNIIFRINTSYFDDRYFTQNAISQICASDMQSIFLKKLRTDLGLIYSITYDVELDETYSTLSNIYIKTNIDNKNIIKFLVSLFKILKSLKTKPITNDYIKKYRNNIRLEMIKDNLSRDPDEYINIYGRNVIFGKEIETAKYVYEKFLKITSKDLLKEAKMSFLKENMLIAYASNKNINDKIKNFIDNLKL